MTSQMFLPTPEAEDIYGQRFPSGPDQEGFFPLVSQLHKSLQFALKTHKERSTDVEQLVDMIAAQDCDLQKKLSTKAVSAIPGLNAGLCNDSQVEVISKGIGIVVKYGLNLLRSEKNPNWRSIQRFNPVFMEKVMPLKGHEGILISLGYSDVTPSSFNFAQSMADPDVDQVSIITADLLILQKALTENLKDSRPNMSGLDETLAQMSNSEVAAGDEKCCFCCGASSSEVECIQCSEFMCITCDNITHGGRKRLHNRIYSKSKTREEGNNIDPKKIEPAPAALEQADAATSVSKLHISSDDYTRRSHFSSLEPADSAAASEPPGHVEDQFISGVVKMKNSEEARLKVCRPTSSPAIDNTDAVQEVNDDISVSYGDWKMCPIEVNSTNPFLPLSLPSTISKQKSTGSNDLRNTEVKLPKDERIVRQNDDLQSSRKFNQEKVEGDIPVSFGDWEMCPIEGIQKNPFLPLPSPSTISKQEPTVSNDWRNVEVKLHKDEKNARKDDELQQSSTKSKHWLEMIRASSPKIVPQPRVGSDATTDSGKSELTQKLSAAYQIAPQQRVGSDATTDSGKRELPQAQNAGYQIAEQSFPLWQPFPSHTVLKETTMAGKSQLHETPMSVEQGAEPKRSDRYSILPHWVSTKTGSNDGKVERQDMSRPIEQIAVSRRSDQYSSILPHWVAKETGTNDGKCERQDSPIEQIAPQQRVGWDATTDSGKRELPQAQSARYQIAEQSFPLWQPFPSHTVLKETTMAGKSQLHETPMSVEQVAEPKRSDYYSILPHWVSTKTGSNDGKVECQDMSRPIEQIAVSRRSDQYSSVLPHWVSKGTGTNDGKSKRQNSPIEQVPTVLELKRGKNKSSKKSERSKKLQTKLQPISPIELLTDESDEDLPMLPIPTVRHRVVKRTISANDKVYHQLQEEGYDISDSIEAARQSGGSIEKARSYFQECCVCFQILPREKMICLPYCQCAICPECFEGHFSQLSQTTSCMYRYVCPGCEAPDLKSFDQNDFRDYFSLLGCMIKKFTKKAVFDLFQHKATMWGLMKLDNFRWCANGCQNGFINDRKHVQKVKCPHCSKYQCFNCNKPWLDQHEKVSCEDFESWKKANDPELQALGLAAHLKENGISCPRCKKRYELAKGGCMHFKCPLCQHEFCCGCTLPFSKFPDCNEFPSCKNKGLHAHHPRDCLYHLRDQESDVLQVLLQKHGVNFTRTDDGTKSSLHASCPVVLQMQSHQGLVEDKCGKPLKGKTGLCETHYKEYLVNLINQNKLDPADVLPVEELKLVFQRREKAVPQKERRESDVVYRQRLIQIVKEQLPLG